MGKLALDGELGCENFEPFVDTYIDGEFGERENAEMEAHLSVCESCRQKVQRQVEFKEHIREQLADEQAPRELRDGVLAQIEELETQRQKETTRRRWGSVARLGWVAGPLAAVAALMFVVPEFTVAPAASNPVPVIDHTVDWHQGNFPLEVVTADTGEAEKWFEDKVDFSVRIPQFNDERVNLLGGRIAHIEDRRAAFVLYEVDGAKLSAILFDGDGVKVPRERLRRIEDRDIAWLNQQGYGVAVVQDGGVTYAMTSDLSEERFLGLVADSVHE